MGNELGGWDGPAPPADWLLDVAMHIKSLAPRTLVADGSMGGLNATARYVSQALDHPAIDLFSNHYYYGESDYSRLEKDAKFVADRHKVFFVGEFGLSSTQVIEKMYQLALKNQNVAGALIWSLRYHSRDGGFYTHQEENGYHSYHVPGQPGAPGFGSDEGTVVQLARKVALQMQGLTGREKPMVPGAPIAIPGKMDPHHLKWMGSAWAAAYRLSRQEQGKDWVVVSERVVDAVPFGTFNVTDDKARPGTKYLYKVESVGLDGTLSPPLLLSVDAL